MATLEIELQPDEQARLQQEAKSEGLGLEDWARRRLTEARPSVSLVETLQAIRDAKYDPTAKPIWETAAEIGAEIPAEEKARVPHDGSINYKHYLYGAPKVEVPKELK